MPRRNHNNIYIKGLFDSLISFQQVIDSFPTSVAILNPDITIVGVNRSYEALTGFSYEDSVGLPCFYCLRSNICVSSCPIKKLEKSTEKITIEANIVTRDRKKIDVQITASPLFNSENRIMGYLEVIHEKRGVGKTIFDFNQALQAGKIIGVTEDIRRIYQRIPSIAQSDSTVLIHGETGSGKDYIAEALHRESSRRTGPFIKANCGALPDQLLESELFGHVKDAFRGALEDKHGRMRLAHNGTLYLSEITELPLNIQRKLLNFLDEQVIYPLGVQRGIHVNVRVIGATRKNILQLVKQGLFREDLYFRLNAIPLHLPSLCGRPEDIKAFLNHFLKLYSQKYNKKIKEFGTRSYRLLMHYDYPGNLRELRNIIEFAVSICDSDQVRIGHLPEHLLANGNFHGHGEKHVKKTLGRHDTEILDWAATERRMISEALRKAGGRRTKAAAMLGWARSTLWRKLKQYGFE
jgi:two-component system, NtrC family, response regulator AtoC